MKGYLLILYTALLTLTFSINLLAETKTPLHLNFSQIDATPLIGCGQDNFVPSDFLSRNLKKIIEYDIKFSNEEIELTTWDLTTINHLTVYYDREPAQASFYFWELAKNKGFASLHGGIMVTFDLCEQTVVSISEIKY